MAFPIVQAVNGGYNTSGTSHTVNLPAGIAVGDLLLVFFCVRDITTITFPGGWTQLFQLDRDTVQFGVWYRIADGGEGATITVTTSQSKATAHTSYRIIGYSGTPEVGAKVYDDRAICTGVDVNPNPPNLIPSWGAEDTLWFACCGYSGGDRVITSYPANYTNGRNDRSANWYHVGLGTARRELNVASEDPGTFTLTSSTGWVANTVAIRGAGFLPGSTHSAVLRVRNPTMLSWSYLIKLLIGPEEKASWTQVVAAGQTVDLAAVVTMPIAAGCYAVTVKVVETSTNTDLGIFIGESITVG